MQAKSSKSRDDGSYIHSLPIGKVFTARAFIGAIGGLKNLSSELLVTSPDGIYFFGVTSILPLPTWYRESGYQIHYHVDNWPLLKARIHSRESNSAFLDLNSSSESIP